MKKKSHSRIVRVLGRIFNFRYWIDWDRLRALTLSLFNSISRFFVPRQSKATESFDDAMKRLKLTNDDLGVQQKALFRLSLLMLGIAFFVFCYLGYQLYCGAFKAVIVSFVLTLIALALAFRYHFWYFQIKSRKLGCTIEEWFRKGLLGEKQ